MTQAILDNQAIAADEQALAQAELDQYIEEQAAVLAPEIGFDGDVNPNSDIFYHALNGYIEQQAQEIAPEFEIDSDNDADFGELFRVWKSYHFLGSFYQDLDGKWVAQPANSDIRPHLNTPEEAQLIIIAASGFLVADAA